MIDMDANANVVVPGMKLWCRGYHEAYMPHNVFITYPGNDKKALLKEAKRMGWRGHKCPQCVFFDIKLKRR